MLWLLLEKVFSVSYEFINQDISEILYSISLVEGISIVADDTVFGTATFRFFGEDFESAFDSFLIANRLYVKKEKRTWIVSKLKLEINEEFYKFDCYDVSLDKIFEYISEKTGYGIFYTSIPLGKYSFHLQCEGIEDFLSVISSNFLDYTIRFENNRAYFEKKFIKENVFGSVESYFTQEELSICVENDVFMAKIKNASFEKVIAKLKEQRDFQFLSLVRDNPAIAWAEFETESFEDCLYRITSLCNVSYVKKENVYVFFSDSSESKELIDDKIWQKYQLKSISAEKFLVNFSIRFNDLDYVILSSNSVLIKHGENEKEDIEDFINQVDVNEEKYLIRLNYISVDDFLGNLPKDFTRDSFFQTGIDCSVYFYGTKERYKTLLGIISEIDKPVKRVAYDLLIIQTQKSKVENWNSRLEISRLTPGMSSSGFLSAAPNFSFNMNLVKAFGYSFATELQASIQENETSVFADTTLYGVSGVPIQFKNTNTFRYRDPYINYDKDDKINTGITREIVSGLVLDIVGRVSGNGTITTSVTASVSKRGADLSSNGNPPPTSEKVITTEVLGKSGEIIVLSGLVQEDAIFVEERTPFISRIPIIGNFFKGKEKNMEKTEMIIYLIPRFNDFEKENLIVGQIFHFIKNNSFKMLNYINQNIEKRKN